MKLLVKPYIAAILVVHLVAFNTYAQNPFDCIDAMEICNADALFIQLDTANGSIDEEIGESCLSDILVPNYLESNTLWFKYYFESGGDFLFTITPSEWEVDIDFVVFKSETQNCSNLRSIRCMFSGENVGQELDSLCMGATGLSHISTDTIEYAGYLPTDDNFLAPIEISIGDVIYLAVIDFYGNLDYIIEHVGTAVIGCEPVGFEEVKHLKLKLYQHHSRIAYDVRKNDSS